MIRTSWWQRLLGLRATPSSPVLPPSEPARMSQSLSSDGLVPMTELSGLWQGHIQACQQESTQAVDRLTSEFSTLDQQLSRAIELTNQAADAMGQDGVSGVVAHAQAQLKEVLTSLDRAMQTKHAMVDAVSQAVKSSAELDDMAQIIKRIADQTFLLSINARVEAARAGGEAGRGFSVVADEVRKLANLSRDTSDQILRGVGTIRSSIGRAGEQAKVMQDNDAADMQQSQARVQDVMDRFTQSLAGLSEASSALTEVSQSARQSVQEALVQFQFQDRVTQRLDHVQLNIGAFAQTLSQAWPAAVDVQALNSQLYSSYTMPEEKRFHNGEPEPAPSAAAAPAAADDGLEFF